MTMSRYARWSAALLSMSLFATGVACTDDPASQNNTPDENNSRMDDPKGEPPAGSSLKHIDDGTCTPAETICTDDVTFNGGRKLKVQLIGGEGEPVTNTTVKFEILENDAGMTNLTAANAATDGEGIAEVDLRAGAMAGTVRVQASTNDPNVNTVEFLISVNPKDAASFNVNFVEIGDSDIKNVDVFLFDENTACDAFMNNPRSLTAQYTDTGEASASGELPTVVFAGIPNGTAFTVGARAYLRSNDEVEVAMGCLPASEEGRIQAGSPVTVTVPLLKHIPYVQGDYRATHNFNLVDALPETWQTVINLIGTVVSDPGAFIVGCGEEDPMTGELMPTNDCPAPTAGIVGLLQDFLPDSGVFGDLKEAIDGFLDSEFVREVARNVINDAVKDFLQNNDSIPSWVGDGIQITDDIYKTLRNFRVVATLRVTSQPTYLVDESGMPQSDEQGRLIATWETKDNEHIWEDLVFYWKQGCADDAPPECGEAVEIDPNNVSTEDFVQGTWKGSLIDGSILHIDEHSLSLNYGTLLLTILEKVALPQIFGDPAVNSIEAMLDKIIDCDSLADTVDGQIGGTRGIVKTLCGQLKTQASDALRDYVATLVLDGDERFVIGTPDGKGCQLYLPEMFVGEWPGKPLPYIERMGEAPPRMGQCEWTAKIKYSDGADPVTLDGTWNAERQ